VRSLIIDHPLVAQKLTALRDKDTDNTTFRLLADELVTLLAYEATRGIRVSEITVDTPIQQTQGVKLSGPTPLIVPILRAGLGMLDGMLRILPTAEVGFLGMVRNDETLIASTYADRLPENLHGRQVFVLDPMLATGGTLVAAIELLLARGADEIVAISLIAAPEGMKRVEDAFGAKVNITIVSAGLDTGLNDRGYIVPGLGDAGDRLFGAVD
jgi:uracil phosphoribosyltransferase